MGHIRQRASGYCIWAMKIDMIKSAGTKKPAAVTRLINTTRATTAKRDFDEFISRSHTNLSRNHKRTNEID